MSRSKEAWWDSHPCKDCGEAPSLLEGDLCESCDEDKGGMSQSVITLSP